MSCEPTTDPDSLASKQELLWARRDATGQSRTSRSRSSVRFYLGRCSAPCGMLNPLIDRRLERDAALRVLQRDHDVEPCAWAPAG